MYAYEVTILKTTLHYHRIYIDYLFIVYCLFIVILLLTYYIIVVGLLNCFCFFAKLAFIMTDIKDIYIRLCDRFKFPRFLKEEQIAAIRAVVLKNNLLCVLPTGFGKSYIYVVPPLILDEVYARFAKTASFVYSISPV